MSCGALGRVQRSERGISERRKHTRYTLSLEISYSVLDGTRAGDTGYSETIDLSSSAVRFMAAAPLPPGTPVEVAINWPVCLDGHIPLQLIATGTVARSSGKETVMLIQKYAFKTRRVGGKRVSIR